MSRILHVITGLGPGGAEGMLRRLCLSDEENEHRVVSLTTGGTHGAALEARGVPVYCLRMDPGKLSRQTIFGFLRLLRLVRDYKPDVLQTWLYHSDLLGGLAGKLARVPRIIWNIRNGDVSLGTEKRSTVAVVRLCGVLSKFIPDAIIYCAESAISVHTRYGYRAPTMAVIPNGYFFEEPRGIARDYTRGSTVQAGCVARFHPVKDHPTLLEAVRLAQDDGLNVTLSLAGSGMDAENRELVELVASKGLGRTVRLEGLTEDVPSFMAGLDFLILSSVSEGFPNVLVEAMAEGTPCISTSVGDAEIIIGDTGWIVPPTDPLALKRAIAEAISELGSPAWEGRRVGAAQSVRERFAIDRVLQQYRQIWCA